MVFRESFLSVITGFFLSDFFYHGLKLFRNTIRVSNSLDPNHALHFVVPDLGSNCLQKLSADNTYRQNKYISVVYKENGMSLPLNSR